MCTAQGIEITYHCNLWLGQKSKPYLNRILILVTILVLKKKTLNTSFNTTAKKQKKYLSTQNRINCIQVTEHISIHVLYYVSIGRLFFIYLYF